MAKFQKGTQNPNFDAGEMPAPPRDLVDFHFRWDEFRDIAKKAAENENLTSNEADTLHWLIMLADRVREQDI